jgi:hypothetical protein
MNRRSFGRLVVLAWALSACSSSPADEVNNAPSVTFTVDNESGVDLITSSNWIVIDDVYGGDTLWDSTQGYYDGDACDADIKDYGGLPPPEPRLAAGEHVTFRWKENEFTGHDSDPNSWEGKLCLNIGRVPPGAHAFTFCATQSGVECVSPTEIVGVESACLTMNIVLTDKDVAEDVVFLPETLPAEPCTTGTLQQR